MFFVDNEFNTVNDENEQDLQLDISKISQSVIWGTDWTTETIARQLEKGNIDLQPSFQRRDAWNDKEKSRLIESLILGFPVPPIILAESKDKKNSYIVIDGKQRLLSIRRFYSQNAETNIDEQNNFKPLKLKGLYYLTVLNNKFYNDVKEYDNDFITNLDNQPIRTIVIKNWADEAVLYAAFHRLNTGGKPLSPQELRQSLMPNNKFLSYLDKATASSDIIKSALANSREDRMKDIELTLRYYAYKCFISEYNGNLKFFLDMTCKSLNLNWDENKDKYEDLFIQLEKTISFIKSVFGDNSPFSRFVNGECSNRFNRSVFEVFTYYFSIENIRNSINNKDSLKHAFIKLNTDTDFIDALEVNIKETNKVYTRFSKFCNMLIDLDDIKGKSIIIPKIILSNGKLKVEEVTS